MSDSWSSYDRAAERGPMALLWKIMVSIMILSAGVGAIGYVFGWFSETAQVAQQEFGAQAALTKYSWFKEAAAALDKKRADIKVYDVRLKAIEEAYKNLPRQKWPREDRDQYNIWLSEAAGVKASYNALAADYNAQMVKFNWRFANVGELPKGAVDPLPREFKTYITE